MKLPKGVLDEKELQEVLKEESGLGEAVERKIEKKTRRGQDKDYDSLLRKIDGIEKEVASVRSETTFLKEKLKEQSDMLLELTRLVKELMR